MWVIHGLADLGALGLAGSSGSPSGEYPGFTTPACQTACPLLPLASARTADLFLFLRHCPTASLFLIVTPNRPIRCFCVQFAQSSSQRGW